MSAPSTATIEPPPVAAPPRALPPIAPPKPLPTKIKIIVRSNPPKALVRWGKKVLGPTPLTLERPRESGPVDLIVSSEGYFPVHARAYTFRNDSFTVRLTKLADRMTLFGAKKELEPPPGPATPGELNAPPSGEPPPSLLAPPGVAPLEPQPAPVE